MLTSCPRTIDDAVTSIGKHRWSFSKIITLTRLASVCIFNSKPFNLTLRPVQFQGGFSVVNKTRRYFCSIQRQYNNIIITERCCAATLRCVISARRHVKTRALKNYRTGLQVVDIAVYVKHISVHLNGDPFVRRR